MHLPHASLLCGIDTPSKTQKVLAVTRWRLLNENAQCLVCALQHSYFTMRQQQEKIDLKLAPEPEAALSARHSLDRLEGLLPPARLKDVQLVVSELVINSVRHAGLSPDEQISLSIMVSGASVRGRVCDPGPGFEKPSNPRPRPDLSGGWGLPIVERISDRWGVERNGKQGDLVCVWFEID